MVSRSKVKLLLQLKNC